MCSEVLVSIGKDLQFLFVHNIVRNILSGALIGYSLPFTLKKNNLRHFPSTLGSDDTSGSYESLLLMMRVEVFLDLPLFYFGVVVEAFFVMKCTSFAYHTVSLRWPHLL